MTRSVLTAVGIIVAYISFFGVGVDALHGMIRPYTPLDGPVTMIEEGNELIGLTLLGALMLTVLATRNIDDALAANDDL